MKQLLSFFVFMLAIFNSIAGMQLRSRKHTQSSVAEATAPTSKKAKLYQATLLVKEHVKFYKDHKEIEPVRTIVAATQDGYCPFFFFQAPADNAAAIAKDTRVKRLRELIPSVNTDAYRLDKFIWALYFRDKNEETPGYTSE